MVLANKIYYLTEHLQMRGGVSFLAKLEIISYNLRGVVRALSNI